MTSKYPDWLIQRVARAAAQGTDTTEDLYGTDPTTGKPWSAMYIYEWEQGAEAVLDALNFRRKTSHGLVVAGSGLVYQAATLDPWNPDSPKLPALESWCAHTEWIEVEP